MSGFDGTYPPDPDKPRVIRMTEGSGQTADREAVVVKDGVPWAPPPIPTADEPAGTAH